MIRWHQLFFESEAHHLNSDCQCQFNGSFVKSTVDVKFGCWHLIGIKTNCFSCFRVEKSEFILSRTRKRSTFITFLSRVWSMGRFHNSIFICLLFYCFFFSFSLGFVHVHYFWIKPTHFNSSYNCMIHHWLGTCCTTGTCFD